MVRLTIGGFMMGAGREYEHSFLKQEMMLINWCREWAMRVAEKSPEERERLIHKVT